MDIIRIRVPLNLICSMGNRARDLRVSDWTVQNVVKNMLRAWLLARTQKFNLTDPLRMSRLEQYICIIGILEEKTPMILFMDKEDFTMDSIISIQTNRSISRTKAKDAPNMIRLVQTSKHLSQIMVFGLVT